MKITQDQKQILLQHLSTVDMAASQALLTRPDHVRVQQALEALGKHLHQLEVQDNEGNPLKG